MLQWNQCVNSTVDPDDYYYSNNPLSNAHPDWTSDDLKYDETTNKYYIFWDEDANSIAACNKWITDNVTQWWDWVWVPAWTYP